MEQFEWLNNIKEQIPEFLEEIKSNNNPGFFRYSFSGDIYGENVRWGLGNTVFATNIYYILDIVKKLPKEDKQNIISFIKSFQKKDGSLFDPMIKRKSFFNNTIFAVLNLDFSNIFGEKTIRAETKQSFAALDLLNSKPDLPYQKIPYDKDSIDKYLTNLNWKEPWGAGSHFSHLIYFLNFNYTKFNANKKLTKDLIDHSINFVTKLQSSIDGSWYTGVNIPLNQRINGAMKVISGLKSVGKLEFNYPTKLIDMCLLSDDFNGACNILDVLYVLRFANELTEGEYRYDEIKNFCYKWLKICNNQYYDKVGGFSFYQNRSNDNYYGAKITNGLNEPDIHGTFLLLYGISLAMQILDLEKEFKLNEI